MELNRPQNLGMRFEGIVNTFGEKTALYFPESIPGHPSRATFSSLNEGANQTARLLKASGVTQGDVVCIVGEKTIASFYLMLAALKIGAPYVILDPECPLERLNRILSKCQPKMLAGP